MFVGLTAATKPSLFCPELLLVVTVEGLYVCMYKWDLYQSACVRACMRAFFFIVRLTFLCRAFKGAKTNKAKATAQNIGLMGIT